jgi:hypothetical protein
MRPTITIIITAAAATAGNGITCGMNLLRFCLFISPFHDNTFYHFIRFHLFRFCFSCGVFRHCYSGMMTRNHSASKHKRRCEKSSKGKETEYKCYINHPPKSLHRKESLAVREIMQVKINVKIPGKNSGGKTMRHRCININTAFLLRRQFILQAS